MIPTRHRAELLVCVLVLAAALSGCGARREAAAPPAAEPAVEPPTAPTAQPDTAPPPDTAAPPGTAPPGVVGAPWDTAARSREARRNHVYPKGESELGRKLVASLPDPGGLAPSEGGAAPGPAPASGECWQAQLLTTSDRARADRVRAEAAALLGVTVAVVSEDGVHRVRAGGCLDAEAALRVVERARREGWPEAFRVRGAR